EAKAFLSELPFKPYAELGEAYQYEEKGILSTLILTGEGPEKALATVAFSLGHLKAKFPNKSFGVINLGVSGLLRKNEGLQVGEAHLVRTLYAFEEEKGNPVFKSFSGNLLTQENAPIVDCITFKDRVLTSGPAEKLSYFAHIVDREAHSIGLICEETQTPFSVIKVISDEAQGEICNHVKEEAPLWSDLLLKKFIELLPSAKLPYEVEPIEIEGLHITVSQQRLLQNLIKACELKGITKESAFQKAGLKDLQTLEVRPKEKTKLLLEGLTEVINPLETELKERLKEIISPLEENGFKVRFEQGFEEDTVHLSATLQHHKNINSLIQGLESFDFLKLKGLFRGKEDKDV
ncbi:MAG: hypothetical protein NXH75_15010, partial [Halobacteriovoraceae bacterium]|nr:hypothetical protein [Halobacteriovoraceae bacterium]